MRKVLLLLVGTAVLWVPAVSVAGDSSSSPSKQAAKTETSHGKSDVSNPANICESQRNGSNSAASHHGHTFSQSYGWNRSKGRGAGANAFGECVSTIAKHKTERDGSDSDSADKDSAEDHDEQSAGSHDKNSTNPAMTCRVIQANDVVHFHAAYGTRPNAFGKCVAGHANSKTG